MFKLYTATGVLVTNLTTIARAGKTLPLFLWNFITGTLVRSSMNSVQVIKYFPFFKEPSVKHGSSLA